MMACLIVTCDRNCGETRRAFNQLKLADRGAARNAAVHLQGSKQFVILRNNSCGTKGMQTKKRCDPGDGGMIGYIVARQGDERNHVANLRINSTADPIENFQKGPTGRNRLKKLFFSSQ
jgi:hypothetical protein